MIWARESPYRKINSTLASTFPPQWLSLDSTYDRYTNKSFNNAHDELSKTVLIHLASLHQRLSKLLKNEMLEVFLCRTPARLPKAVLFSELLEVFMSMHHN